MAICITFTLQSERFATALYFSDWYKFPPKNRKMILQILSYSQKPLEIRVPFFTPSISVLGAVSCNTLKCSSFHQVVVLLPKYSNVLLFKIF